MKIRYDACYASLPAEEMLQILKESEEEHDHEKHRDKLAKLFGKRISRSTYYRMLARFREIKPSLIAEVEAGKAPTAQAVAGAGLPALTEIRSKIDAMAKRLDQVSRQQSFMSDDLRMIKNILRKQKAIS